MPKPEEVTQTVAINLFDLFSFKDDDEKQINAAAIVLALQDKNFAKRILDFETEDEPGLGLEVWASLQSLRNLLTVKNHPALKREFFQHTISIDIIDTLKKKLEEVKKLSPEEIKALFAKKENKKVQTPDEEDGDDDSGDPLDNGTQP